MNIHFKYKQEKYIFDASFVDKRLSKINFLSHKIPCSLLLSGFLWDYDDISYIKEEVLDLIQDVLNGKCDNEVAGAEFSSIYITPNVTIFYTFGNLDEKNILATYTDKNSIETGLLAALLKTLLKELENNELTKNPSK